MSKRSKRGQKWEMATPIIRPTSLIASQQFKNLTPFKASYVVDKHIDMNYLMGWQYGRIWFNEYKRWESMTYGSADAAIEKDILRRKNVQRALKKKRN